MVALITEYTCADMSGSVAETPGEGTENFSYKNSQSVGYPGKHSPLPSDCFPPPETETNVVTNPAASNLNFTLSALC